VVKNLKHDYRPARRSWQKVRTRVTAEAVVGGVIGPLHAQVLILGRVDDGGRLRVPGRTGPVGARNCVHTALNLLLRRQPATGMIRRWRYS
jgi:hypothetical protein